MSRYASSSYTPPASVTSSGGGSTNFRSMPAGYIATSGGSSGPLQTDAWKAVYGARSAAANYGSQVGAATGAALSTYGQNLKSTLAGQTALPTYTPTVQPVQPKVNRPNFGPVRITYNPSGKIFPSKSTQPAQANGPPVAKMRTGGTPPESLAKLLAEARASQPMHGGGTDPRGSWSKGKWGWNNQMSPAVTSLGQSKPPMSSPTTRAIASTAAARAAQQLRKVQLARSLANARKDPRSLALSLAAAGGSKPNPANAIQVGGASLVGTNAYLAAGGAKKVPFTSSNAGEIIRAGQTIAPALGVAGILEKGNKGQSALSEIGGAFNKKLGGKIADYTEKAVSAVVPEKARGIIGDYMDQVRQVDKGVTPLGEQPRTFSPGPSAIGKSGQRVYGPTSSKTILAHELFDNGLEITDEGGTRKIYTPPGKDPARRGMKWKRVLVGGGIGGVHTGILDETFYQWRVIPDPNYVPPPITTDSYIDPPTVRTGSRLGDQTPHQQALKGASQTQQGILDSKSGDSDSLAQLYNDHRDSFNSDLAAYKEERNFLNNHSGYPKNSAAYANYKKILDAQGQALVARHKEGMDLKGKVDSGKSMMQKLQDTTGSAGAASSAADEAYNSLASEAQGNIAMTTLGEGAQGGKAGDMLKSAATFAQMFPGGRPYAAGAYTAAQILSARNQVKDRRKQGLNIPQSLLDVASSNAFAAASGLVSSVSGGIQTIGNLIHPRVGDVLSTAPRLVTNAAQMVLNAAEGGVQTAIGTANVPPGYAKTEGFDAYGQRIIPGGETGYSPTAAQAAADQYASLPGADRDVITLMEGGRTYEQALALKKAGGTQEVSRDDRIRSDTGYTEQTLNGVTMWVPPGHMLRESPNSPPGSRDIEAIPSDTPHGDRNFVNGLSPYETQQAAWQEVRESEAADRTDYTASREMAESGLHLPETYGEGKFGGAVLPDGTPVPASREALDAGRPKPQGITTGTLFATPGGFTVEGGMTDEDFLPKPTVGRQHRDPKLGRSSRRY